MTTLKKQWKLFEKMVIPKDVSWIQTQEMKRAFYAGAEAFNRCLFDIQEESISEDHGVIMIEELHGQLRGFADDVEKGKA